MKSLFNGTFNDLSVLDIGQRVGSTGYIDFISPGEMTAPIMRGKDLWDREFFVIRAQSGSGPLECQAFFRRETVGASWSNGESNIIYFLGDLIRSNGEVYTERFEKLKTLMQTGQLGRYTLC